MTSCTAKARSGRAARASIAPAALLVLVLINGCATRPAGRPAQAAAEPLPPSTQVSFYPTAGQSAERQDRDRFECHLWSVQQTGFDPSLPYPGASMRITVVPVPPPGADTAVGAVAGAIAGAVIGESDHAGPGAAIGAAAGATLGAASDIGREREARRIEQGDRARDA